MNIESAAVRWVAANIVAALLPPQTVDTGVTSRFQCPHCRFELHGYQAVAPIVYGDGRTYAFMAYECVRCAATFTAGDWNGDW